MEQLIKIFETILNNYEDYSGFSFESRGNMLSIRDKEIIKNIAEDFYDSTKLELEQSAMLSIGNVIIKGKPHPTAGRRKYIEGFVKIPTSLPSIGKEDPVSKGPIDEDKVMETKEQSQDKLRELLMILYNDEKKAPQKQKIKTMIKRLEKSKNFNLSFLISAIEKHLLPISKPFRNRGLSKKNKKR
ncbi:MAG: hypothetical protein U0X91_04355 [Spirosomataceae bacterium]